MDKLIEYAAEKGYGKIRLDVIDINDRARRLYENLGFKVISRDYHPYLQRYIGFSSSTTIIKELK